MTNTPTVLVVDDEADLLQVTGWWFEQAGYRVLIAPDGAMALKTARAEHPDVIILDIMMPVMDGFQVLRELKRDPVLRDISVITLTVKSLEHDINTSIKLGALCHLVKPYQPKELLDEVERAVARHRELHGGPAAEPGESQEATDEHEES